MSSSDESLSAPAPPWRPKFNPWLIAVAVAFGVGVVFGLANLILIGALLRRQRGQEGLARSAGE